MNLSPAAVQRRIAAMEDNGTITANVAIVSPVIDGSRIAIVVEVHLGNDRSELAEPMKALFREPPRSSNATMSPATAASS